MRSKGSENRWRPEWLSPDRFDTIIVAFAGVYGRLFGKRYTYDHFANHVAGGGMHACSYLLTSDIGMNALSGFRLASWEQGFGDFLVVPDTASFRPVPWRPSTALVLGDLVRQDGSPVAEAPRQVLSGQIGRLAALGYRPFIGSELEFALFDQDYRAAAASDYRELRPSSDYYVDYHILQPGRDEDFLGRLRSEMTAAGIAVECSKGECGLGQHEVNLAYCDALQMADRHVVYKTGAKDIASQMGRSITFMAKWDTGEAGNGLHIHVSLQDAENGRSLFWDSEKERPGPLFGNFLGGLLKYSRELAYFSAPTVNSYKRYRPGSWAPTAVVCGEDNRTCGLRVVGRGDSLRIENRMPGADANAYLAFAATLAAGLAGIEEDLEGEIYRGNAYVDQALPRLPGSLAEARTLLEQSAVARAAFGDDVVDLYVRAADAELEAAGRAVTDWERRRYFEQL
jgi:glutamine synthetase